MAPATSQIHHKGLVVDGLTQTDGERVVVLLELLGIDDFAHGNDVRVLVRNLDADGAATRNRRNDTNA